MGCRRIHFFLVFCVCALTYRGTVAEDIPCSCARAKSAMMTDGVCQNLCTTLSYGIGPRDIFENLCAADGCKKDYDVEKVFPGCDKAVALNSDGDPLLDKLCRSLCHELILDSTVPPEWKPSDMPECNGLKTESLITCFKKHHRYQELVTCGWQ